MFINKKDQIAAMTFGLLASFVLFMFALKFTSLEKIGNFLSPIAMSFQPLKPLEEVKKGNEVFGFLPSWNVNKTDTIDFSVLTTLAYFDWKADGAGNIDKEDSAYKLFHSAKMTTLFKKAHREGTRVVVTLTMMNADDIIAFLDDPAAQDKLINDSVDIVDKRGIDGINIDFEYFGGAGAEYRPKFTAFVDNMSKEMHAKVPGSQVSVSLYASVVESPRLYDLKEIARVTDKVFMMAYDFATLSSEQAMPTAPLYGHEKKKWWLDVATAVDQFLTLMPADKLILGNPLYNLDFPVVAPEMKAATLSSYWGGAKHMTYAADKEIITADMPGVTKFITGWDDDAKVAWKAYYIDGTWRMSFQEDERSMRAKYDFALSRKLAGIGLWALGNEGENPEVWATIKEKLGAKYADSNVVNRLIADSI